MPQSQQQFTPIRTADGRHAPYAPRVLPQTITPFQDDPVRLSPLTSLNEDSTTATLVSLIPPPPSYHAHHQHHHLSHHHAAYQSFVMEPVHAAALTGHCDFIQIPAGFEALVSEDPIGLSEALRQSQLMPLPLFIGQVCFEMTAGEMQWLIKRLTGVHTLKIEPRGPGCFVAVVRTSDEVDLVLSLHRRLLFDHAGVWYARTAAESVVLEAYVAAASGRWSRGSRLPRDTMIIERQRGSLNPLRSILGFFAPAGYSADGSVAQRGLAHKKASDSGSPSPLVVTLPATPTSFLDDRLRCNSDSVSSIAGLSQVDAAEAFS